MEENRIESQSNPILSQTCLKHGLLIKYFCIELQSIDSLMCETCYLEKKNLKGKVQILLFELIYQEVQKEISAINLDKLQEKCNYYIQQVNQANKQDNLYSQNQELVHKLQSSLNKSHQILNQINQMKQKISCKIWSSYFVQAIKNKIVITQIEQGLKEVEENLHLLKNGFFKYHRNTAIHRAYLLGERYLLIQNTAGNLLVYDSNTLLYLSSVETQFLSQTYLMIAAFMINKKRIGILFENANLMIFNVQANEQFKLLKRLNLKKIPQSILVSNNFLRLDYKRFIIIINARNFKTLQQTDNIGQYLSLNKYNFFQLAFNAYSQSSFNSKNSDIFKDQEMNLIEIHTCNFCLTCMQWICQKITDKNKLLTYTNNENRVIKIYSNGVKL